MRTEHRRRSRGGRTLAARNIDISAQADTSAITSSAGGTVTNDVRVTWDDTTPSQDIIQALRKAFDRMIELESQGTLLS